MMVPSHAAHAIVIALGLPSKSHYYNAPQNPAAIGCAFCGSPSVGAIGWQLSLSSSSSSGGGRRSRAGRTSSSRTTTTGPLCRQLGRHQHDVLRTPFISSRHSTGSRGVSSSLRVGPFVVAAAARRWNEQDEDDWDEEDDVVVQGTGRFSNGGRRVGRSRRAPWEDIQWNNAASSGTSDSGGGGNGRIGVRRRARILDDVEEEEDSIDGDVVGSVGDGVGSDGDDVLSTRDRQGGVVARSARGGRGPRMNDDDVGDLDDDFDVDEARPPRRRRRRGGDVRPRPSEEQPAPWDAGWFQDAQRLDERGMFGWVRNFYNSLFWYGGALEDSEQLPAMNFKDLLERFDESTGGQWARNSKAIVPPEELAAEQDYRWRPSARDAPVEAETRRGGRAGTSSSNTRGEGRRRRRVPEWVELEEDDTGGRARSKDGVRRRRVREEGDTVATEQLRRKQGQLVEREYAFQMDLEKVQERLGVVDATVELWLRRSAGMVTRGSQESDTEMLQAKRRIYGLKDEGRRLDSAKAELESRLEDCRAKLDRILVELDKLGEDPEMYDYYKPIVSESGETAEAGSEVVEVVGASGGTSGLEGLEKGRERDMDKVPVATEEPEMDPTSF